MFIWAHREQTHGHYLRKLVPLFFALDHQNYARRLPIHIRDLEVLPNAIQDIEDLVTLDTKLCESAAAAVSVRMVESIGQEQYNNFKESELGSNDTLLTALIKLNNLLLFHDKKTQNKTTFCPRVDHDLKRSTRVDIVWDQYRALTIKGGRRYISYTPSKHRHLEWFILDTDVVVILLSNFHHIKALNPAAEIRISFKTRKTTRIISLNTIATNLGTMTCKSMALFYAFTESDSKSSFKFKDK
ncbi:hypothetical protein LSH36_304g04015 [Paralvinella palmiformis]|uniref:Uncharacterized protein n=1 Tax=Paralvinella palmiformis TaxID=53620 RepID=A0AAD9JHE8_9ANNE|nr:hypothetical protein LSH36_304g04015 [Paralvinella palmiformis]